MPSAFAASSRMVSRLMIDWLIELEISTRWAVSLWYGELVDISFMSPRWLTPRSSLAAVVRSWLVLSSVLKVCYTCVHIDSAGLRTAALLTRHPLCSRPGEWMCLGERAVLIMS